MKLILMFALLTSFYCSVLQAENPEDVVKEIFDLAMKKEIVKNKSSQQIINNKIAFEEMSQNILGTYVNKISKTEFQWFQKTITGIITKTVYPEAPSFLDKVKITYQTPLKLKDKITINSQVKKRGEEIDVQYILKKIGKSWKVVDIAIDFESWTESISEQVFSVIKKENWSGLKEKLNKKLMELDSAK